MVLSLIGSDDPTVSLYLSLFNFLALSFFFTISHSFVVGTNDPREASLTICEGRLEKSSWLSPST